MCVTFCFGLFLLAWEDLIIFKFYLRRKRQGEKQIKVVAPKHGRAKRGSQRSLGPLASQEEATIK